MARARMSCTPPAANGTTIRVRLPCPWAAKATQDSAAATTKPFNSLLAAFLARRRLRALLWPVVVRGERVRRGHVEVCPRHPWGGSARAPREPLLSPGVGPGLLRPLLPGRERGGQ